MKVLGVSGEEQKALWLILGAIYHLGAAGATKGRKTRRRRAPMLRFMKVFRFTFWGEDTHKIS